MVNPDLSIDETVDEERSSSRSSRASALVDKLARSCQEDPKGSVHKAWGVSLIFVLIYFLVAVLEMLSLRKEGGSKMMIFASIWTGLVHLFLAILGTFVLKRFPTSFAIGFFLGLLVVFANQNLILFAVFRNYSFGNRKKNRAFANFAMVISLVLSLFTALLTYFRQDLVVAAVDVKGLGSGRRRNIPDDEVDDDGYKYEERN